jgi:hypothetical protein
MPAKSIAQRRLMGMALHHPEKVSEKNKGILKMSHADMEDFASTNEKGLKQHVMSLKRQGRLKSKTKKL